VPPSPLPSLTVQEIAESAQDLSPTANDLTVPPASAVFSPSVGYEHGDAVYVRIGEAEERQAATSRSCGRSRRGQRRRHGPVHRLARRARTRANDRRRRQPLTPRDRGQGTHGPTLAAASCRSRPQFDANRDDRAGDVLTAARSSTSIQSPDRVRRIAMRRRSARMSRSRSMTLGPARPSAAAAQARRRLWPLSREVHGRRDVVRLR
jgi:hypothetical protein